MVVNVDIKPFQELHLQTVPMSQQMAQSVPVESSPSSSHSNDVSGDAEGVWSPDIDQAFHEALTIYPPCGRRKIILSEEGKMYGRNELIARYIKIRCGKTRTRKQVSSHIQVLARKKNRENQSKVKVQEVKTELINPPPNAFSPSSAPSLSALTPAMSAAAAAANLSPQAIFNQKVMDQVNVQALAEAAAAVAASVASTTNGSLNMSSTTSPDISANGLTASAGIPWPYMMPGMFNNNFYGNVGMNNDQENIYLAAAALSAQQMNGFGQNNNPAALLPNLSALNKLLPQMNPALQNPFIPPTALSISTPKLSLNGFSAYMEKRGQNRVEMVKIPEFTDEPQETIRISSLGESFSERLHEEWKKGPKDSFFLVKFWANVQFDCEDHQETLFAVDQFYQSKFEYQLNVTTKLMSFGKLTVEKVEDATHSTMNNLTHQYQLEASPMCDYMVQFIEKLKGLARIELMNSVLENLTVLQIVTDKLTDETLMVICISFEVSPEAESSCRVYKVVE